MTRRSGLTLALLVGLVTITMGCAAGPSPYERDTLELLSTIEKLNDVMAAVRDEAGARALLPQLEAIKTHMKEMQDRPGFMTADDQTAAAVERRYGARITAAEKRISAEARRLQADPVLRPLVKDVLELPDEPMPAP